jgi:hypothetical protein
MEEATDGLRRHGSLDGMSVHAGHFVARRDKTLPHIGLYFRVILNIIADGSEIGPPLWVSANTPGTKNGLSGFENSGVEYKLEKKFLSLSVPCESGCLPT